MQHWKGILVSAYCFHFAVPLLHDQASWTNTSVPTMSMVCHFPMSVLSHEQHDDYKTNCISKEEKNVQVNVLAVFLL